MNITRRQRGSRIDIAIIFNHLSFSSDDQLMIICHFHCHLMIVVTSIISEHYKALEEVGLTSLSLSTITFLNNCGYCRYHVVKPRKAAAVHWWQSWIDIATIVNHHLP